MDSRPVGVFDSGVGGLSVLREIRRLLPAEDLLYVADSGHCPYGGKPPAEIRARACAIAGFLVDRGAKAIVVACNTATVAAIADLRRRFALPIVGMEPAVKPAAAITRSRVVGVLATGATLAGDRFASLVERFADGITVLTQPCPGLVEQVEAGDLESEVTLDLLRRYTIPLVSRGADALVLGCTHYPFLRTSLAQVLGPEVSLIDTGEAVARQLRRVLDRDQLRAPPQHQGEARFFTSARSSGAILQRLWGDAVPIEQLPV